MVKMRKDSTIISLFSVIFIIVLVITVILSLKYFNSDSKPQELNPAEVIIPESDSIPSTIPSQDISDVPATDYLLTIEQTLGNNYVDILISNPKNISAVEFTIMLPPDIDEVTLSDKELFYDFVYNKVDNKLLVGAISLQVVSPKNNYRFLRLNFNKPLEENLEITLQTFNDQQGDEIL